MKRFWGAYGNKPDDANTGRYNPDEPLIKQFRTPVHCAVVSKDDIVYVCDRVNDRIQSFTPDGKFIKEVRISPNTLGDGSTWDIAFSKDPQQKFMYLADGHDEKVWILDRDSMEVLTSFGDGRQTAGSVLRRAQHRHRLKGQYLHDRNLRRSSLQRFISRACRPSRRERIRARSGRRRAIRTRRTPGSGLQASEHRSWKAGSGLLPAFLFWRLDRVDA